MSETFWLHVLFFAVIGILHYCSIKHSERMEDKKKGEQRTLKLHPKQVFPHGRQLTQTESDLKREVPYICLHSPSEENEFIVLTAGWYEDRLHIFAKQDGRIIKTHESFDPHMR
jgi:hypothetical protein